MTETAKMFSCPLCCDDFPLEVAEGERPNVFKCLGSPENPACSNACCSNCLVTWLKGARLDNKGYVDPVCFGCRKAVIPMTFLERVLGEKEFSVFDHFITERAIKRMTDVVVCSTADCGAVYLRPPTRKERGGKEAAGNRECQEYECVCGEVMCSLCGDPWTEQHAAMPECKQYAKWKTTNDPETIDHLAFLEFLGHDKTRKCPTCSKYVEKTHGCSHMQCTGCATSWCWNCQCVYNNCQCSARARAQRAKEAAKRAKRKAKRQKKKAILRAIREKEAAEAALADKGKEEEVPEGPSKATLKRRLRRKKKLELIKGKKEEEEEKQAQEQIEDRRSLTMSR